MQRADLDYWRKDVRYMAYEKVLVRRSPTDTWIASFFSHTTTVGGITEIVTSSGQHYLECLPYSWFPKLLGTTKNPEELLEEVTDGH